MPDESSNFDLKTVLIQSRQNGDCSESGMITNVVKKTIYDLCCRYLGDCWKSVPLKQVDISPVSGGTSNLLFLASLPLGAKKSVVCPRKVLVRVYFNPETENNLITESVIFTLLSERRLGPRLYGVFNCGRLEEFVDSSQLSTQDLQNPLYIKHIARKMAQVHELCVPIDKDPWYIFEAMERWLQQAFETKTTFTFTDYNGQELTIQQHRLHTEIESVKQMAAKSKSPVVFCHNDLQEGNVLLPSDSTDPEENLVLIDYEYAAYNFRAFDFANHFSEWCIDYRIDEWPHFKINVKDYPSYAQQESFCEEYFKQLKILADKSLVDKLISEVHLFKPLPHLFWSIWALLQMEVSPIHFGYREYAAKRLALYFKLKDDPVKEAQYDQL